jgi:hypothetical protein
MSIARLAYSEPNKALYDLSMNLLGAHALVGFDYTYRRPEDLDVQGTAHGLRYAFLRVRANSIEGATSEIMRHILGEQLLGLPASLGSKERRLEAGAAQLRARLRGHARRAAARPTCYTGRGWPPRTSRPGRAPVAAPSLMISTPALNVWR